MTHQVSTDHYRVSILTDHLVRLEWRDDPDEPFEDRPTQVVVNRDLPEPATRIRVHGQGLRIVNDTFDLRYDGRRFSRGGLYATVTAVGSYHAVWRFGDDATTTAGFDDRGNLGGTTRTLDGVDGRCPVGAGVASRLGWAVLDDSTSLALDDGWVAPRHNGAQIGGQDLYLFLHGLDPAAAVADFYRLTGPQPVIPRWALGNWWSRYHAYSQDEYLALMDRFAEADMPLSVAVIDMDWHLVDVDPAIGHGWTGYTWNRDLFPDPPGFLAQLHERGLHTSLNLHPADGVRRHEEAYPALAERLGRDPGTGEPIDFDAGDRRFMAAYLDTVLHPLEEQGVDLWWLDWQQGTTTSVPGLDPLWILNHVHHGDSGRHGATPLTFSRYAGPGSHRYPIGFSGDSVVSWASLDFQPEFTATASNIGYGWWSHDIGGHWAGVRDDELMARWAQLGVFSPVNRLHSTKDEFGSKEPWHYGGVTEEVMAECLRLRHRLVPYLDSANLAGHRDLVPLVRPVYWTHPRHDEAYVDRNEYWFGDQLLVRPVTTPVDRAAGLALTHTWLPPLPDGSPGTWVDLFTGIAYDGGRQVCLARSLREIPVLARPGAIIVLASDPMAPVDSAEDLTVHLVAGAAGRAELLESGEDGTSSTVIEHDGTNTLRIRAASGQAAPPRRHWRAVVHHGGPRRSIDLGTHPTDEDLTVALGPFPGHGNPVLDRGLALVDAAQIEFQTKWALADALRAERPALTRVAMLLEVDAPEALRAGLVELLTAQA